jgi:DNA polymerase III subunit gamma/tau
MMRLQSDGGRGLMLDARRTALQVPLMREVTALQRIRTLQDPGTSSSVTSAGSSGTGKKTKKGKTFLGDPHRDAQALAIELSGKLANSAHAPSLSDHARPPNPQRRGKHGHARVAKPRTMKSTIPGEAKLSDPATSPIKVDVRERIKRIESAFERSTTTVSGELRKEGLLRELKARGRDDDELVRSDDRWDGGMARREELARKIIDEQRGSSVSSLAQLLGNHYGSGRSALDLLGVVADEEHFGDEILFQSDEEDEPPPPLSSRGHDALAKPRAGRARARKRPASARLREPSRGKPSAQRRDPPPVLLDAVSSLPHGCGIPWDWSRLTSKRHEAEHLSPPVQSISSLDSDANALPLIIGEDAHDSDPAGYYIEPSRCHAAAARPRQAPSLQSAVKDVPEDVADAPAPRTLSQKYRPKNFREIVGQAVVVRALSAAIVRARVAPVYLFMGPRGTGKTSTARVFAAGLNCLSPDSRPCGTCRECRTMSTDVREIDAASTTDLTSMRVAMGSFAPQARFKVFIVEGCDCLTPDIWNAFLKVLEEPPRNVVFILITTDADRIPVTATSRCQKFPFAKLKPPDIITRLELLAAKESLVVEPGAFPLIASRSDGSLRDAETILDQLCLLDKHISLALVQELVSISNPSTSSSSICEFLNSSSRSLAGGRASR